MSEENGGNSSTAERRSDMKTPPWGRGLYLITPDCHDSETLLARVAEVLPARPALLQYRNKLANTSRQHSEALALRAVCEEFGVPLIINDDWRLALRIGAAGAHLGEHDGDLRAARAAAPELILGASCYDDFGAAEIAAAQGASYVAFGAFFQTTTKATTRRATPDLLLRSERLSLPRVAIGGLTPENAGRLVAAGADLLAVVGAVFDAPNPLVTARQFQALFETP